MCHADISPISFHINVPVSSGIFPRLATTHTCRNFTKIQEWGENHAAGDFKFQYTKEEGDRIAANAGFDQAPEEDISFMWRAFPGDPFFKQWRNETGLDG
jgi:hypothetical protein